MVIGRSFHGSGNWHNAQVIRRLLLLALLLTCTARRRRQLGCANCGDRDIPDVFHRGGSTGAREQMGTGPEAGEDQPARRHARGPWRPCARASPRPPTPMRATTRSDLRRGVLRSVAFISSALFSLPAGSTGGTRIMTRHGPPSSAIASRRSSFTRAWERNQDALAFLPAAAQPRFRVLCALILPTRSTFFFVAHNRCDDPRRRSTVLFNETKARGVVRREKRAESE